MPADEADEEEEEEEAAAAVEELTFDADQIDHCETSLDAYQHVTSLLRVGTVLMLR